MQEDATSDCVLSAGGSKLLRANTETPLAARAGDLLFAGDGLRTEAGPASFLFCPAKTIETLSAAGEVHFDAKQPKSQGRQDLRNSPLALVLCRRAYVSRWLAANSTTE